MGGAILNNLTTEEEASDISAGSSTLASRVYERLRDDIVFGALPPSTKLTLDVLKARYDVGMTPLREGLYRLSASMLVTLEDRRGFRVAPISPRHLVETIATRVEVETLLLCDAFRHGGLEWETRVVATCHRLMRVGQYKPNPGPYTQEWEEAHRDFHFALLSAAELPMLQDFHQSLWDHAARYRNLARPTRIATHAVYDGHQQLMEAAVARDAEMACMLLRRHIELATRNLMQTLFPLEPTTEP